MSDIEKEGAAMEKKWSSGKIAGVIIGSVLAGMTLIAVLFTVVFLCVSKMFLYNDFFMVGKTDEIQAQEQNIEEEVKEDRIPDESKELKPGEKENKKPGQDLKEAEEYTNNEGYYEFKDYLKEDLSYEISFRNYDYAHPENENIKIQFVYPVVKGDKVPNLPGINESIQKEMQVVAEYVSSMPNYLSAEENYRFEGTGYVTYMSENILSIVYVEYGYMNDAYMESYVVPVNIDMQSGLVMNNAHLINVNDKFSIDFRTRCQEQNGEVAYLSMLSDQDITSYLTDKDYVIAFYTPLGMEVGFNYFDGWVTVTYKDYQKYQTIL